MEGVQGTRRRNRAYGRQTGPVRRIPGEVRELAWFDCDNLPPDISEPVDKAILRGLADYVTKRYGA